MDLAQNQSGGFIQRNGDLTMTTGIGATLQRLRRRLRFFASEWFLDTTLGIPYLEEVFQKNPPAVVLDTIFKRAVIECPGVLGLEEFDLQKDSATRGLRLEFQARSTDGNIEFDEEIP